MAAVAWDGKRGDSHYAVLGLLESPGLTRDEIRQAYHRTLLELHPDKEAGRGARGRGCVHGSGWDACRQRNAAGSNGTYLDRVMLAWKVLSDPGERQEYDRLRRQQQQEHDTVDLDDMRYDESHGLFSLACRCGGEYALSEADMDGGANTVECSGCTLAMRVLYEPGRNQSL